MSDTPLTDRAVKDGFFDAGFARDLERLLNAAWRDKVRLDHVESRRKGAGYRLEARPEGLSFIVDGASEASLRDALDAFIAGPGATSTR